MAKKALLIGINDYPEGYELRGCVNDSMAIESALKFNEDGSLNFGTKNLNNCKSASIAEREIKKLFQDNGTIDMALLYFSGHGFVDANDNGQIVFPNSIEADSSCKGIYMSNIMKIVRSSTIRNKIVIFDCCHSAKLAYGDDCKGSTIAVLPEGCSILSACRSEEVAIERDGQGLFTSLLLQALKGESADYLGNITAGGIYAYIDKCLSEWEQRPVFKTNVSSFAVIKKVNPKVPTEIIKRGMNLFAEDENGLPKDFPLNPSFEDTNDPNVEHKYTEPYATTENIKKFKILQKLQSIGFVEPVDADYMYFAAMESKSCRLTKVGQYYWKLAKDGRLGI